MTCSICKRLAINHEAISEASATLRVYRLAPSASPALNSTLGNADETGMDVEDIPRRILLTHAPPEAFAEMSRTILKKLGYAIVTPEEFPACAESTGHDVPDLRIVDERNLAEVPEDGFSSVPIIVLTGRHGVTGVDSRIVGAIRRPAGMHDLYRLAQEVLEDTPRTTPRIPTHFQARCRRDGKEWTGAVLSLSENGCLLRSTEPQMLGARFTLRFSLPRTGILELEAEVTYQLVPDLGMTFHATSPSDREAISDFISQSLLRY
jgi:hypothetical protein